MRFTRELSMHQASFPESAVVNVCTASPPLVDLMAVHVWGRDMMLYVVALADRGGGISHASVTLWKWMAGELRGCGVF